MPIIASAATPRTGSNPCLAPLKKAPFYAMKLIPGDIGTYTGAGITIGPALTFGYIAARHAAGLDGRAAQ